ncbi:putative phosphatase YwpJ [compost metagenome]
MSIIRVAEYSAIILDLDGTLLNSDKQISDRNFRAILDCHHYGMKIIFATARPPRAVRSFLQEELIKLGSFIYYNGAYVLCEHTGIHYHEPIHAALTAEVIDFCLRENPDLDLSIEVQDEWMCIKESDYSALMKVSRNPMVKPLEELKKLEATKILFSGKINELSLRQKFDNELNIVVTDNGELVQISSAKASKEQAALLICEGMKIPLEQTIVFGDDHNDIGLFKMCGWPVAMGNAIKELKGLSKEVTDTNDNDGVAIVLEKMMRQ